MRSVLDSFGLAGRRALVTGSSAGIGLALARGLAQAGATIILNARGRDKLEEAAAALRAEGAEVHAAAFDVTDGDAVTESWAASKAASAPSTYSSTTPGCSAARRSRIFRGPTGMR